jgi:hypothetical protein
MSKSKKFQQTFKIDTKTQYANELFIGSYFIKGLNPWLQPS